jgi:hypothetical protein
MLIDCMGAAQKNKNKQIRKTMKHKRIVTRVMVASCSVTTLLACVSAPKNGATCGTSMGAYPSDNCVALTCGTLTQTCSGSSSYYYCQPSGYTASCTTVNYTLYIDNEGTYCDIPSAPGAAQGYPCTATSSVGPGCI